ncbi:MAG TPA: MlaD family protein [Solirubrobacteraceae bacterium]|nr:MlaD family protein [Solirubrobacteraceae bacterium]
MLRRRSNNPFSSPVLIGALTVLVMIVGVVLAFQANSGLPFVPRYTLHIDVANAEELTHGAEIHMGGALIGSVSSVSAARARDGEPIAVINAQLNKSVEPLPVDTRFTIRLKGAIGQKYLDVTLGHSRRTWRNGATVPVSQTGASVDLDQVLDMYTPPTQKGVADTTNGFAQALAGRGVDLNNAIGAFGPLVRNLAPVMRNLAAPKTGLTSFIQGLGSLTAALAPVSQQEAQLYQNLDTSFRALAGVAVPYLQDWISQTPPTFQAVISDAPSIEPFALDTANLFAKLQPGFATLPQSAPQLAAAFQAGARNLPATAQFDRQTVGLAKALAAYSRNATVENGVSRLTLTANSLIQPLQFLAPVQTRCNYVTLFLRNVASSLSDNAGTGTVLRVLLVFIDNDVAGGEAAPSALPYTSYGSEGSGGPSGTEGDHGLLHFDPYPNTASPGEVQECSAGNEPYSSSQAVIGNPSTKVGTGTEKTTVSGG